VLVFYYKGAASFCIQESSFREIVYIKKIVSYEIATKEAVRSLGMCIKIYYNKHNYIVEIGCDDRSRILLKQVYLL